MKREIAAAVLLCCLFITSLINISWFQNRVEHITAAIEQSRTENLEGSTDRACLLAEKGLKQWLSLENYTHIFIRHPEIDSATDAFYELVEKLSGDDSKNAEASFEKLIYHLEGLVQMEKLRLGSIL